MATRRVLGGLSAFLIGGGLVAAGWAIQGTHQYLPALLLELGASFFLVVPLLVFERLLSGQITEAREAVRQDVDAVRGQLQEQVGRLDELDRRYADRQAKAREDDALAVAAVRDRVTLESLHGLMSRAIELRSISARGMSVGLDHVTDRVMFRAVVLAEEGEPEPAVWIDLVDVTGAVVGGSVIWSQGEAVEDVWQRLVEAAQQRNRYPGDGILVPGTVIGRLLDAVNQALNLKSSPRGSLDIGPVIEFVGDWAVTERGLEHAGEPSYSIPVQRLLDDPNLDEGMLEKMWVDAASYRQAARLARSHHDRIRRARIRGFG